MGRTILILLFSIFTFVAYANAEVVEAWICQESSYGSWKNILVKASVNKGRERGTIEVAGVKHQTKFAVKGFERRWDFGLAKDYTYDYSFIIKPNGRATYCTCSAW